MCVSQGVVYVLFLMCVFETCVFSMFVFAGGVCVCGFRDVCCVCAHACAWMLVTCATHALSHAQHMHCHMHSTCMYHPTPSPLSHTPSSSGLPHLTLEAWHHSLTRVTTIRPPHVSVYDLQLEPQTRFGRRFTQGDAPLPNDDTSAAMFCAASNVLKGAGYEHYEISNYALEGARSVHNQVYWACRSYYAFGLGAASYLEVGDFDLEIAMGEIAKGGGCKKKEGGTRKGGW